MDDRLAHFFVSVGELCAGAALAELEVELTLEDGTCARGVPRSIRRTRDPAREVDDSGYDRTFRVDGRVISLDGIIACRIHAPRAR